MNVVKMTVNGKVLVQGKKTPRAKTPAKNFSSDNVDMAAGGPASALMQSPPEAPIRGQNKDIEELEPQTALYMQDSKESDKY